MAQTLDKAMKVIEAIAAHQPVEAKELSRILKIPLPTLYRFIATLEANGYVARVSGNARYQLGLLLVRLGAIALKRFHLSELIHPVLREVADQTMESSSLQVRKGMDTICIDCAESPQRIRFSPQIGRIRPLYAGAVPRVLLAHMKERERIKIVESLTLKKIGPKTLTDKHALKKELEDTLKRGYAVSEEELTHGAVAVAVPVLGIADSVVATLTVNGPKFRMRQRQIQNAVNVLKQAAVKLSHQLPREFVDSIG